jgi:hypothetical protein
LGFALGAAAAPYYYGAPYGYGYGYGYDDGPGYYYDAPAYACGAWQWDPYRHRRVWVNTCD